jgi:hypothetical protein
VPVRIRRMLNPLAASIADGRQFIQQHVRPDVHAAIQCPCCQHLIQTQSRKLNASWALVLVAMAEYFRDPTDAIWSAYQFYMDMEADYATWVHVERLLDAHPFAAVRARNKGRDFGQMEHWGLIQRRTRARHSSVDKRQGFWRLTPSGRSFVRGQSSAYRVAYIADGHCYGMSDGRNGRDLDQVTILEVAGDDFDYQQLSNGVATLTPAERQRTRRVGRRRLRRQQ